MVADEQGDTSQHEEEPVAENPEQSESGHRPAPAVVNDVSEDSASSTPTETLPTEEEQGSDPVAALDGLNPPWEPPTHNEEHCPGVIRHRDSPGMDSSKSPIERFGVSVDCTKDDCSRLRIGAESPFGQLHQWRDYSRKFIPAVRPAW